jgi:hypothetical protein
MAGGVRSAGGRGGIWRRRNNNDLAEEATDRLRVYFLCYAVKHLARRENKLEAALATPY